jgi:hypothetical protein
MYIYSLHQQLLQQNKYWKNRVLVKRKNGDKKSQDNLNFSSPSNIKYAYS